MRAIYMYDDAGQVSVGFVIVTSCDDENEFDECMLQAKGIADLGYADIEDAVTQVFKHRGHECWIEHENESYWLYFNYN